MAPVRAANDAGPAAEPGRRVPVVVVCSARPRVGRTLIARLLIEYFVADGRRPLGFDLNPNDPVLSDWLPASAIRATIAETKGQMALFDRLVVNDGRPKVIDLAPDLFEAFFDVVRRISFADGARARGIDTAALFVAEDHARSLAAYHQIVDADDRIMVAPVRNQMGEVGGGWPLPAPTAGATRIHIECLSPYLHGVVDRRRFSFAGFLAKPVNHPTPLHEWIGRAFVAFRDLELRLMMSEFAPFFRPAPRPSPGPRGPEPPEPRPAA